MKRQRKSPRVHFPKSELFYGSVIDYYLKKAELMDSLRKGLDTKKS